MLDEGSHGEGAATGGGGAGSKFTHSFLKNLMYFLPENLIKKTIYT